MGFVCHPSSLFIHKSSYFRAKRHEPRVLCTANGRFHISRREIVQAASVSLLVGGLVAPVHSVGRESEDRITDKIDVKDIASAYDRYSAKYDELDGGEAVIPEVLGFAQRRAEIIGRACGHVLEVGCGTGANFPYYELAPKVSSITGLDMSSGMLQRAREQLNILRASEPRKDYFMNLPVKLVHGDVLRIPFDDESFDTVLDTFSLCVFQDPLAAMQEMKRVLKRGPGSKILLLEHSVSHYSPLAWYQNLTADAVASLSKGCFWNQNVLKLCEQAGLMVRECKFHAAGTVVQLECERSA